MAQSMRFGSSLLARVARHSTVVPRRAFTSSVPARRPDLIQSMYLKELEAYKPAPTKPGDAEGHVQTFTPPAPPKSPEEANIASDMKAYEDQVVEIEGQAAAGETAEPESNYFEDLNELDEEAAHGH